MVEFDIAITVSDEDKETKSVEGGAKAKVNIQVVAASLGSDRVQAKENTKASSNVSRVKFRIPVVFPMQNQ